MADARDGSGRRARRMGAVRRLGSRSGARLGVPSEALVQPCLVRVGQSYVSCNEIKNVCVADAVFYLSCIVGPRLGSCTHPDDDPYSTVDGDTPRAAGDDFAAADAAIDTLRRVRDERMSASVAKSTFACTVHVRYIMSRPSWPTFGI